MKNDGTLSKLIEIFRNNKYINKQINNNTALSVGFLFREFELPPEFRTEMILNIKSLVMESNRNSLAHIVLS